jgi:serine/threonine protein kinase
MESPVKITMKDFTLLKVIGKGSYGKVLLVRKKDTGEILAMKILRKDFIAKRNQIEHTRTERSVLERVKHPFIVQLKYAFQNSTKLYFVLEYCPGGELFFHLSRSRRFDETRVVFYAACVVLAIEHLHELNVVYRE